LFIVAGERFQVIQILDRLARRRFFRRLGFGKRPWRKAVARAVLHFMQQAFNQIPVISRHPDSTSGARDFLARSQVVTGALRHRSGLFGAPTDRRSVDFLRN
jgi:hypothetical protein